METIYVIFAAIVIVCAILQIILFFKVWGMTNDIEKITNIVCHKSETSATTPTRSSTVALADDMPTPKEEKDPEIANTIIVRFDNETVGRLKTYPRYPQHSVITKDGFELLYENKNAALKALEEYLLSARSHGLHCRRKDVGPNLRNWPPNTGDNPSPLAPYLKVCPPRH